MDDWLAPFRGSGPVHVDALELHLDRMAVNANANEKEDKEKKMTDRYQYTPGPASGALVQKDGEKWTLIRQRTAPPAGKSLAGAYRPGASARVGAI